MRIALVKGLAAVACLAGVTVGAGVQYQFSSVGEYPGAYQTFPLAHNLRQIVGYYASSSTVAGYEEDPSAAATGHRAFFSLAPPGSGTSYAAGINNKGVVVGGFCNPYCNPLAADHGFTYSQGTYTTVDYPQTGATTAAYGINDSGEVVGGYCAVPYACPVDKETAHGFLDNQGIFTKLDFPGSQDTQADAINNAGVIVGAYDINNTGPHGFIYQDGVFTNIDVPGGNFTVPGAINRRGVVVGYYQDSNHDIQGFVYDYGKFSTVTIPHAHATGLNGINDAGVIVGDWLPPHGEYKTFKGIPVRDPFLP